MTTPRVSIIIPTYGRSDYLKDLIESVRASTPVGAYEFVVVTSDLLDSDKVKWLSVQPDVKVVPADTRHDWQLRKHSLPYYMNQGVKNSQYEWVLITNDDMRFDPAWYQELTKLVTGPGGEEIGMIIVATHVSKMSYGHRAPVIGKFKRAGEDWRDLYLSDFAIRHKPTLEAVGYFDENMSWHGYGTDNTLTMEFLAGKKVVPAEQIKIDHFLTEENRNALTEDEYTAFHYVRRKWDKWCAENGAEYQCDFGGLKPYTLKNRFINFLRTRRQIWKRYFKYFKRYLKYRWQKLFPSSR